jgi:hypothetical protein
MLKKTFNLSLVLLCIIPSEQVNAQGGADSSRDTENLGYQATSSRLPMERRFSEQEERAAQDLGILESYKKIFLKDTGSIRSEDNLSPESYEEYQSQITQHKKRLEAITNLRALLNSDEKTDQHEILLAELNKTAEMRKRLLNNTYISLFSIPEYEQRALREGLTIPDDAVKNFLTEEFTNKRYANPDQGSLEQAIKNIYKLDHESLTAAFNFAEPTKLVKNSRRFNKIKFAALYARKNPRLLPVQADQAAPERGAALTAMKAIESEAEINRIRQEQIMQKRQQQDAQEALTGQLPTALLMARASGDPSAQEDTFRLEPQAEKKRFSPSSPSSEPASFSDSDDSPAPMTKMPPQTKPQLTPIPPRTPAPGKALTIPAPMTKMPTQTKYSFTPIPRAKIPSPKVPPSSPSSESASFTESDDSPAPMTKMPTQTKPQLTPIPPETNPPAAPAIQPRPLRRSEIYGRQLEPILAEYRAAGVAMPYGFSLDENGNLTETSLRNLEDLAREHVQRPVGQKEISISGDAYRAAVNLFKDSLEYKLQKAFEMTVSPLFVPKKSPAPPKPLTLKQKIAAGLASESAIEFAGTKLPFSGTTLPKERQIKIAYPPKNMREAKDFQKEIAVDPQAPRRSITAPAASQSTPITKETSPERDTVRRVIVEDTIDTSQTEDIAASRRTLPPAVIPLPAESTTLPAGPQGNTLTRKTRSKKLELSNSRARNNPGYNPNNPSDNKEAPETRLSDQVNPAFKHTDHLSKKHATTIPQEPARGLVAGLRQQWERFTKKSTSESKLPARPPVPAVRSFTHKSSETTLNPLQLQHYKSPQKHLNYLRK